MRRLALLLLLGLACPAAADEPPQQEVTITAGHCIVKFTNPMLGLAWARVVFGEMPPEMFVALFRALHQGDPEQLDKVLAVQHFVDGCMGAPA